MIIERRELLDCTAELHRRVAALEAENKALREQLDRYAIEHPTICYECGKVVPKP